MNKIIIIDIYGATKKTSDRIAAIDPICGDSIEERRLTGVEWDAFIKTSDGARRERMRIR